MTESTRALLADVVLYVHFAFVLFVVGGLVAIYAGGYLGWGFVRNRLFRILHVAAIGLVTFEALFHIACPLTVLEGGLRNDWQVDPDQRTFMSRLIEGLLYVENPPPWLLPSLYAAVLLFTLAGWYRFPPARRAPATKRP